jgi:phosphate transport system substrate-binding protein
MNIKVCGWAIALSFSTLVTGCSVPPTSTSQIQQQPIVIDGSSTVFPLTDEVVKEYKFERSDAPEITVAFSGTGGGFRKFCAGDTDINNASRPIVNKEIDACKANQVKYIELPVAYDALTIVVHPSNTWAQSITLEELKKIWEPAAQGKITRWNQIRPEWPDKPLNLYGAGRDSGTFDYFTEIVVGKAGASRNDYTASEDDYELMRRVRNDPNGLGYFGYAYYEESQTLLKAVAIDEGRGPVLPSNETVLNGQYQSLARPLFIYVNAESLEKKPGLQEFVQFYLVNAENLSKVVGYVPLSDETYTLALDHFQSRKVGTAFAGYSEKLTLQELLKREKQLE